MKRKTLIALLIATSLLLTSSTASFSSRINLHGGRTATKSMAIWELYKFRDTELLRMYPLRWCPWTSYVLVNEYVTIEDEGNQHWLCINADLYDAVIDTAKYNYDHARKYKGKAKQKVKKIYAYCRKTNYQAHKKTARDVFENRTADCAGISEAFYVMCRKNGIQVKYVIGWCYDGCHAWNMVRLKGRWYYVDATMGRWLHRTLWDGYSVMEMW